MMRLICHDEVSPDGIVASAIRRIAEGRRVTDERMPNQIIDDMAAARAMQTDAQVLAELVAIPPLADEADPCWHDHEYWHQVVYPYLALWNLAAERRLRDAIPLILDRACIGDPGEIMRNLCHKVEAIVKPDWSALTTVCIAALSSSRPGTRYWAAFELGRLRDPTVLPALERSAQDAVLAVREKASNALERLASEAWCDRARRTL